MAILDISNDIFVYWHTSVWLSR